MFCGLMLRRSVLPVILIASMTLGQTPSVSQDGRRSPEAGSAGSKAPSIPDGFMLIEGDILVPVDFFKRSPDKVAYTPDLWPGGVVPYEFDANVTAANRTAMEAAMVNWEDVAAVDFRPRAGDANFVHIQDDAGNRSHVGMRTGRQDIWIASWNSEFTMVHELGHTLGLWHEQSRWDRDSYVRIVAGNICQTCCAGGACDHNFDIDISGGHGPYDFESLMHYGQCDFSVCSSCPNDTGCAESGRTIVVLPPNESWQSQIGQGDHLSAGDRAIMVFLYGCPDCPWGPTCPDCDGNAFGDDCEMANCRDDPACDDCNGNGVMDACDVSACTGDPSCGDCNFNGIPDGCDIRVPQQVAKLTAHDGAGYDFFGHSVAIDGNSALVGAYGVNEDTTADSGAAYMFSRYGGVWSEIGVVGRTTVEAGDAFGWSVSLDGGRGAVGAHLDDIFGGTVDRGAAFPFDLPGNLWVNPFTAQLRSGVGGAAGDNFGSSVALQGNTAVVGSWKDDILGETEAGSAYVFRTTTGSWIQQFKLTASDAGAYDRFGVSVAVWGDTAIVGSYRDGHTNRWNAGSAYVFTRSGTIWTQQAKLIASSPFDEELFGQSVALYGDTAFVGAPGEYYPGGGVGPGSVYVFTRTGTTWTQQARLTASDGEVGDGFGYAVAVQGVTALIGAPYDDLTVGAEEGSAYVFVRSGAFWREKAKLTASDAKASARFGCSASLDDGTGIVGAERDDVAGMTAVGAAYVFTLPTSADCNNTGVPDECEYDCTGNGIVDDCEIADCVGDPACGDCNGNTLTDECDIALCGHSSPACEDCNSNGVPDGCDLSSCSGDPACADCQGNAIPDECDIASCAGDPACGDCNLNGSPDGCDLTTCGGDPACSDCNGNSLPDACDIAGCSGDPSCGDCNVNGIPDGCELLSCAGDPACADCNGNSVPDACDIAGCAGDPACGDCNVNGIPDGCELAGCAGDPLCSDCNGNSVPDACDIAGCAGDVACADCDGNSVPDACDVSACAGDPRCSDCDLNGVPDSCDIVACVGDPACADCDGNSVPDACDLVTCVGDPACGDCQGNGVQDACDIASCAGDPSCADCQGNGVPDGCDLAPSSLARLGLAGVAYPEFFESLAAVPSIDEWVQALSLRSSFDCNVNSIPDECDISSGQSQDHDGNGIPDDCEVFRFYVNIAFSAVGAKRSSLYGMGWDNPFWTLQEALDVAVGVGEAEIWVAAGTYTPDYNAGSDSGMSFALRNKVALYGGFIGVETERSQRDPVVNETALSGDLNGDDGIGIVTDNSIHVITAHSVDSTAVLDGFTVSGGNAIATWFPANSGGGLYSDGGSPTIRNCTFTGNTAGVRGGAMYTVNGAPTIDGCTFTGNSSGWGGAMRNTNSASTILDCVFSGNSAVTSGAAAYSSDGGVTFTGCTFDGNDAGWGSALYNDGGLPIIEDCTFTANTAVNSGAAVYNSSSDASLVLCTFQGNSANWGGAIYNDTSAPNVSDCGFDNNQATYGGALVNDSIVASSISRTAWRDSLKPVGGNFEARAIPDADPFSIPQRHRASRQVGQVYQRCTFTNNTALYGGAVMTLGGTDGYVNCRFDNNVAEGDGGAMNYQAAASGSFTNCEFFNNRANGDPAVAGGGSPFGGGAVALFVECNVSLTNCALVNNQAGGLDPTDGGGGLIVYGSTATVINSVLWNNSDVGGTDESAQVYLLELGAASVDYSCVQGGWSGGGAGNLSSDPGLSDVVAGDVHLARGSLCIDAGDNTAAELSGVTVDLDGNLRYVDDPATPDTGVGAPPVVDLGPYEFFDICPIPAAPEVERLALPDTPASIKNRFLAILPGNAGLSAAVRVVLTDLPSPFEGLIGEVMWVEIPAVYCENSGQDVPGSGECSVAPGSLGPTYFGATLGCTPAYADWSVFDTVHIFDELVIPGASYTIQIVAEICDTTVEANFSGPLNVDTNSWGDSVGAFDAGFAMWGPADGVVNVTTDVVAQLDKFSNLPSAPAKVSVDIDPSLPNHVINITDVTRTLDAFRGASYPFQPGPAPCRFAKRF